jgi:hypothetical protein
VLVNNGEQKAKFSKGDILYQAHQLCGCPRKPNEPSAQGND